MPNHPPRQSDRVLSPKLEAAVVLKKAFWRKEYTTCQLIDISHGGLCFLCKENVGTIGSKLELDICHLKEMFHVRGFIAYKSGNQYGLSFIHAPVQLDRLIDIFLGDYLQRETHSVLPEAEVPKHHRENRFALKETQIYVRKYDSQNPFIEAQVENISKGGIGFSTDRPLEKETPFLVSIQIADISGNTSHRPITGKVCYMNQKPGSYYHGVKYTSLTMDFVRLLESLEFLADTAGN